jgi:hypothetical protein
MNKKIKCELCGSIIDPTKKSHRRWFLAKESDFIYFCSKRKCIEDFSKNFLPYQKQCRRNYL